MKRLAARLLLLALTVLAIAVVAVVISQVYQPTTHDPFSNHNRSEINWRFDHENMAWQVTGSPVPCPEPFSFPAPVDVTQATSVLYPGQIRGNDYKPHGGFRFDRHASNAIDVYAPFDGRLFKAARHTQGDEMQYTLYVMHECGMMYKFDHLLELTEPFAAAITKIPLGGEGDTRTTAINPPIRISKGEHIATQVGLRGNVFFDFGVYDVRQTNGVAYDAAFRARFPGLEEYGQHAICWLDNLEEPAKSIVKRLPGADGQSGTSSDYCD